MTTRDYRTSEAVVVSSTTLFRTNMACQAFVADAAARVRWLAYEPSCLTTDTDVSHWKLAIVLTVRINVSCGPSAPPNWSEFDPGRPFPRNDAQASTFCLREIALQILCHRQWPSNIATFQVLKQNSLNGVLADCG